jgi:large subunit ribosomal protein L25
MEQASLKAEKREHAGSKGAEKIRKAGRLPATVYGHKQAPESISVDGHDFALQMQRGIKLFDVDVAGKNDKMLVKELQYDYLGKNIIHIDFIRVNLAEKVKVSVPVELKGVAKGASEGGIIQSHLDKVELECLVTEIPDAVVFNVKNVGVGDAIHASDLPLPQGVKLLTDGKALILTCNIVAVAKSTEEIEAETPVAGPEVITERKPVEGEEETPKP